MAGKLATVGDRVRGCIAFALTIACVTGACNTDSRQWQASFLFGMVLYLCTGLAIVGESMDE